MPEEILYCDQCVKRIPAADIRSGDAVVAANGALCAACVDALSPERRGALKRLVAGGSTKPSSSAFVRAIRPLTPKTTAGNPKRGRKAVHPRRLRGATGTSRAPSKAVVVTVAGLGAGLVVGALVLMLGSSGPSSKPTDRPTSTSGRAPRTTRARPPTDTRAGQDEWAERAVVISPVTGQPLRSSGGRSLPAGYARPAYRSSASAPARRADLARGLVAHWKLDGIDETAVADASGNGHDGTAIGGVTAAAGRIGGAFSFNGTDAHVEVAKGAADLHLADLTIAFWVRPAVLHGKQVLVAKRHDGNRAPYWTLLKDDVFEFAWSYDTEPHWARLSSTPGAVPADQWTHVAVTRDNAAGDACVYVNGVKNAQLLGQRPGAQIGGTTPSHRGMKVTFGSRFIQDLEAPGRWFTGELDDIRIYNRALAPDEIGGLVRKAEDSRDPRPGPVRSR